MAKHPFEYQAPTPADVEAISAVREAFKVAYDTVVAKVPMCEERVLAMRALEQSSMWANKAIVFDGEPYLMDRLHAEGCADPVQCEGACWGRFESEYTR